MIQFADENTLVRDRILIIIAPPTQQWSSEHKLNCITLGSARRA